MKRIYGICIVVFCTVSSSFGLHYNFSTINQAGFYKLAANVSNQITISADNVTLDMSGYTVSGGVNGIQIQPNFGNIVIRNGTINTVTSDGIFVGSGCNDITIEDIVIKNALIGIHFSSVTTGAIENCEMSQNTTGILLDNSHNINLKNCVAFCNTHASFDLISSTTNCFEDCKALSTGEGNVDLNGTIFGFVSQNGYGNIFERCIANSTQGLTVTGADSLISGFALRGTEHATKIIACEAANSTTNPQGFAIPYGILIEGALEQLHSITGDLRSSGTVFSASWSPDRKYIAAGGGGLVGGSAQQLQVLTFDQAVESLSSVAGDLSVGNLVYTVSYSPDGEHIAIGGSGIFGGTGNDLQIFSFNRITHSLAPKIGIFNTTSVVLAVNWSSDGRYLAVGGTSITGGTGDNFQIMFFDPIASSLQPLTGAFGSVGTVRSVSWSSDNKYVAVGGNGLTGGTGDNLQIFAFENNILTSVAGGLGSSGTVRSVSWSPDNIYVAVGGNGLTGGTGNSLQIFSFDDTYNLVPLAGSLSGTIQSLSWSSDGKYVAVGGNSLSGGTGNNVQIFLFDRGTNTLIPKTGLFSSPVDMFTVQWAPDGSSISVGGNSLSVNALQIISGLTFPQKNVLKNNTVYSNFSGEALYGLGISGSSISNMIIGNTAYNNPHNYAFVTNVFNDHFGSAPTDMQNIAIKGCETIGQPGDTVLFTKQILEKVSDFIPSQLDIIESIISGLAFPCASTSITSPTTISSSGYYCLGNQINGTITIAASDVVLDMNQYVITDRLIINGNLDRVQVGNGTVQTTSSGDAISVGSGTTHIGFKNIVARNAIRGVALSNVTNGIIEGCDFTQNNTGLELDHSHNITVKDCVASTNSYAGFSLISSSTNCFENCKALSNGEGNSSVGNTPIYGFVSTDGHGNVFEQCIANATKGLTLTTFDSAVAGFALRGSESCTKIIECEAANSVANASGITPAHGIFIENSLGSLATVGGALGPSNPAQVTDWSSDGKYIAVGRVGSGSGAPVIIFQFNAADQTLDTIVQFTPDASDIDAIRWSPDGQYLAVGYDGVGIYNVSIYAFDASLQTVSLVGKLYLGQTEVAFLKSIDWSFDGQYIAVCGRDIDSPISSNQVLQIAQFDKVSQIATPIASALTYTGPSSSGNVVRWSPDGKYVAVGGSGLVGGFGTNFQILSFNRVTHALQAVAGDASITLNAITLDWSRDGKYIAVGTNNAGNLRIYSFDSSSNTLTQLASASPGIVTNLTWSPDSRYVAAINDFVNIYSFNRLNNSLTLKKNITLAVTSGLSWSPDGSYLAACNSNVSIDLSNKLVILDALNFPQKNIITNNTVYGNHSNSNETSSSGISGSSIANIIIENSSYNNVYNYTFVTNVYNPLFNAVPSDVQNISLEGCEAICQQDDPSLLAKQDLNKLYAIVSRLDDISLSMQDIFIKLCFSNSITDVIESLLDSLTDDPCAPTPIIAPTTISTSGIYCCANQINGTITIAASDVWLDLNTYTVTNGIVINSGFDRIQIQNGIVEGTAASDAIAVGSGSTNISIQDVTVKNARRGIYFDNVSKGLIDHCDMTLNTTGLTLNNSHDITIKDSVALANTHAGFDLISSTTNCFEDCKALSTGEGTTDLSSTVIYGFVSSNGYGNIFERCIANSTQGLTVTGGNSVIAGFALKGSEHCTKIIDSEASNSVSSSNGTTIPYGILLQKSTDSLSTITAVTSGAITTTVRVVAWSPDGKYVAAGLTNVSATTSTLYLYEFDYRNPSLDLVQQFIPQGTMGDAVCGLDWSPDGLYLSVGFSAASGQSFAIYSFDTINQRLQYVTSVSIPSYTEFTNVKWRYDGRFLAVSGSPDSGQADLFIYEFDRVSQELIVRYGPITTDNVSYEELSWSHDGNYLAGLSGSLIVYRFDQSTAVLTAVSTVNYTVITLGTGLAWSPDDKYLAVGGFITNSSDLLVYSFNKTTETLTNLQIPTFDGSPVYSITWLPDGTHMAIRTGVSIGNQIINYRFDPGTRSLITVASRTVPLTDHDVFNFDNQTTIFSPDGQYVLVGGSGATGNLLVLDAFSFPEKNVITGNTVYCNSGGTSPSGIGISGSSIANMIIGNTSYNSPQNYAFVTNVFNQLFGQAPSDIQNIGIGGCQAICQPEDTDLIIKQVNYKLCGPIQSQLDALYDSTIELLDKQCLINSQVDVIESKLDLQVTSTACSAISIFAAGTINSPGFYCLANNISGTITIAASDVVLDLNRYKISNRIVINNNLSDIFVKNGTVEGTAASDAIAVGSGSRNISIQDVTVKNARRGIYFDNVSKGLIDHCDMTLNTTGLTLNSSHDITIKDSVALANTHAGFDLISSTTNCFEDCKALSTGEGTTDLSSTVIYGFVSSNGYGNIFERCIANSTQGLTVTGGNSVIAGFALKGSEHCTKIIDSEASNSVSSSNGTTIPYGILLQKSTDSLSTITAVTSGAITTTVRVVAWSPDGKYVAAGLTNVSATTSTLYLYEFDYQSRQLDLVQKFIPQGTTGDAVCGLDWSPDGLYLAVGFSAASGQSFAIYSFDTINERLQYVTSVSIPSYTEFTNVKWRYDGIFLAVSGSPNSGQADLFIYEFDRVSQELILRYGPIATDNVNYEELSWSHDGNYLAGLSGRLIVYRFDQSTAVLTAVSTVSYTAVTFGTGLGWSPDDKYLAVGGFITNSSDLLVYSFNKTTETLTNLQVPTFDGSPVYSITWLPDGTHMAIRTGVSIGNQIINYRFDAGTRSLITVASRTVPLTDHDVFNFDNQTTIFSPDGQYVLVGGSGATGNLLVLDAFSFPEKNVITGNTVYCNSGGTSPSGIGISGSSIANMIIGNTSYNSPQNYAFVTNVFSQLFGQAPSDLQNISVAGCVPICTPNNLALISKQIQYKLCNDTISRLDYLESQIDGLNLVSLCAATALTSADISAGLITLNASGNYCLATDLTTDIAITTTCVTLDLNERCLTGVITVQQSDNVIIQNGYITPAAPTISPDAAITITHTAVGTKIEGVTIHNADTQASNISGRSGIAVFGPLTQILNCNIISGSAGNSTTTTAPNAGDGIILGISADESIAQGCIIKTGNGGSTTNATSNGGNGGRGIRIRENRNVEVYACAIISTGSGGQGGASGVGGNGGTGIVIDSNAIDASVRNCSIQNTGAAGSPGAALAGRAIDDDVSISNNLSMIFSNFANNIAYSVKYTLQGAEVEAGILSPNPPTGTIINPLANVYVS